MSSALVYLGGTTIIEQRGLLKVGIMLDDREVTLFSVSYALH